MKNRIIEIAVTDLATKLDEARQAANDIEETASQSGVYGDITDALRKTLAVLRNGDYVRADAVYESILANGYTVKVALEVEATAVAEEQTQTPGARIRKALDALAEHGVTEKQVQAATGISDELWAQFTNPDNAELTGIRMRELVMLADALFLDAAYLLTGDRSRNLRYSPCTLVAMIAGRYPAGV